MDGYAKQETSHRAADKRDPMLSMVIPVFNSDILVRRTVERALAYLDASALNGELILVNDGSTDGSWAVLKQLAVTDKRVVAIDLLKNYGQHSAVMCGLQQSRGEYVVTLDDDLQNPPEEIAKLLAKAYEGHDVVFGRYHAKKHPLYRRIGSNLIAALNRSVFQRPPDLAVTNFRLLSRAVVRRMSDIRTAYPYINGLALMCSCNPANVAVEHLPRQGASTYSLRKILQLVMRILFNYSSVPLRAVTMLGISVAAASFLLGTFYVIRGIIVDTKVQGWTTTIALLSFFSGTLMLMLGMIGEYLVRLINQTSSSSSYYVRERIQQNG